jgi:hypothetical protein
MPFYLYDVTTNNSARQFRQIEEVRIAGSNGPLALLQRQKNSGNAENHKWHATGREIVAAIHSSQPGTDIVIDLKPLDTKAVSLFRLLDVWGFSEKEWTPVSLHLEELFIDKPQGNPAEFKQLFNMNHQGGSVGEFLYLLGGTEKGTWNWGSVGQVNGALLWPDAFKYLTADLGEALRQSGKGGKTPPAQPGDEPEAFPD